ncbi:acyltransferase [Gordonia sp. TBRC 11910]|uniref:Acyltransferase n=1 Tax=Gordonia asplenii TaxID=2725283 RepID=A0A848L0Z7_9ACTN|nr:acyltransferase [Gordonia asplenii]NMO02303.1 acyltransferase [Gordonia asplenii]
MRNVAVLEKDSAAESTSIGVDAATRSRARVAPRAYTADFVRVALFTLVVIGHCVNSINTASTLHVGGLVGTLCHLTRYGFVAVTLFVLVVSTREREMSPIAFWRRRFGLVVWPYLLWTLIYAITDHVVISGHPFGSASTELAELGRNLLTGDGKYQLYFLLISMQIYLAFPAISWLLRRVGHHPWRLVGGAAAIQISMFAVYQYAPRPSGSGWATFYDVAWKSLPMYALFVAIGALGAYHRDAVHDWLRDHAVTVLVAGLAGGTVTVIAYWLTTTPTSVPAAATTPWNPTLLPWLVGGFALLWMVAMWWNHHRGDGRGVVGRVVTYATPRAFGVFAVHPLVIDLLARAGYFTGIFTWFPQSGVTRAALLVVAVLGCSLLLVDVALRTPLSRILVGRDRIPLMRGSGTGVPASA